MTDPVCPDDGAPMRRDTRPVTLSHRGESITVDIPGWYCDECGAGIVSGPDMKLSDRALNRMKARVDGLLEPERIRRIRKRLALSQTDAGEIIGGGPRAFQKYESGDLLPSRAIGSALMLPDHDPDASRIARNQRPVPPGGHADGRAPSRYRTPAFDAAPRS